MSYKWVYATASMWKILEDAESEELERLWLHDLDDWIISSTFGGPVYVSTSFMILTQGTRSFTIARVNDAIQRFNGPCNRFIR